MTNQALSAIARFKQSTQIRPETSRGDQIPPETPINAQAQKSNHSNESLTRTRKDCVVVALANYTQKPYDTVLLDLYKICDVLKENHYQKGFKPTTYIRLFEQYVSRKAVRLRSFKGNNITGLLRVQNGRYHHLVFVILGNVYEYDGTTCKLNEYRAKGWTVKDVWL